MSSVQGNIIIDLPDGVSPNEITQVVNRILQQFTGLKTKINIMEVDDPASLSPIRISKLAARGEE
jgi:hypothetical protein